VNGVVGAEDWVDARPRDEHATIFPVDPRGARIFFLLSSSLPAVELVPRADEVIALERLHIVNGRAFGVEAFAIDTPVHTRQFYFPEWATEACVEFGSVDAMGEVPSDCSGPSTVRVACPSERAALRCEVFEGYGVRVTGDGIGLAWVPGGALTDVTDLRRALLGAALLGLPGSV
jgi:hypothetical protein